MNSFHVWFPLVWFFQAIFIGYYGLHLKVNGGIAWAWSIVLGPIAGLTYLHLASQRQKQLSVADSVS